MIQLRYFASLREQLGIAEEQLTPPPEVTSIATLRAWLATRDAHWQAALAAEQPVLAAINQTLARPDAAIADGDEIAFFSPVSGG